MYGLTFVSNIFLNDYAIPLIAGWKTSLFPPIADHNSRVLILDTMPGEKSLILQQYYACKSNFFWKILCGI